MRKPGLRVGTSALTVTPDPDHAGEGSERCHRTPERWPSSAAVSSGCRWPAARRRPAGRCECIVPGSPARPGWPPECWRRTARAGPAKSDCCSSAWSRCGSGSRANSPTVCPREVITARESLAVAVDRADVADLRTVADWLSAQGHPVVWESAVRDVEPMLAQGIRHGFRAPTELAVDNRALLDGLTTACERLGVDWDGPVADLDSVQADAVVIANGIDAPSLWPGLPIRPVKGEVLRLRWRQGCMPLPQRVIRARVHGRQVYVVPRDDGVVVGATQYEHGRDTAPTVSGVRDLLDDACTVMPALGEYELAECVAGLRPMTPDNLPLVGRLDARTLIAAGHGRSGFLLAPWTAEQIVSELNLVGAPR